MQLSPKVYNALSSERWFHATTKSNFKNILESGIIVDFNKGKELDFGYGFYLTTTEILAESYITRLFSWQNETQNEDKPVIMEYKFSPLNWFENPDFSTKIFSAFDDDFAEFVFLNRLNCNTEKQQHEYDVIYGVMSDSVPTKLLLSYRAGDIEKDSVLDGLKKGNSMKQLSLHKQELCNSIVLNRAYEYNPKTQERKEIVL